MKLSELIEQLSKLDPDYEVLVCLDDAEDDVSPLREIEIASWNRGTGDVKYLTGVKNAVVLWPH